MILNIFEEKFTFQTDWGYPGGAKMGYIFVMLKIQNHPILKILMSFESLSNADQTLY